MYHILVCDDDRDIVSALTIYLTGEGYAVTGAGSGQEALELFQQQSFDLVLMDIMTASPPPPSCAPRATSPSCSSPPRARTRTKFWA